MPAPDDGEEKALVARCLARRPGAWEAFLARYAPEAAAAVRAVAARWGLNLSDADAADLLQETFLVFWREDMKVLRAFRWECALSTYVRTVAASLLARWRRREAASARLPARPVGEPDAAEPAPLLLARDEERAALRAAMDRLPARERRAMIAFYWDGADAADIARMLDLSPAHVRTLLSRARANLAEILKKNGI